MRLYFKSIHFRPLVSSSEPILGVECGISRFDLEELCRTLYDHGEQYEDGTAAIDYGHLARVYRRLNIVTLILRARKYGWIFYDGEFKTVRQSII